MLSAVQHQRYQPQQFVPEVEKNNKNFRTTDLDEDFYYVSQHVNSPELSLLQESDEEDEEEEEEIEQYYNTPINTQFEIANRAFYATINKFTRQSGPDASRRRSPPYSFLENLHLHSIYSKSQQTLLGISPVKPSVLLSGDDFMFTPPFIQQQEALYEDEEEECYNLTDEEEEYYDEEESVLNWDQTEQELYSLSPCPKSNSEDQDQQRVYTSMPSPSNLLLFETILENDSTKHLLHPQDTYFNTFDNTHHHRHAQDNLWIENKSTIHIQPLNDDLLQGADTDELYTTDSSSSDEHEDDLSFYNITNLYDETPHGNTIQPIMSRSTSMLSQKSEETSISSAMSYQSLADIMNNNNKNTLSVEPETRSHGNDITSEVETIETNIHTSTARSNTYASHHDGFNNDVELGTQHQGEGAAYVSSNFFVRFFIYLYSILQLLIFGTKPSSRHEREPLL